METTGRPPDRLGLRLRARRPGQLRLLILASLTVAVLVVVWMMFGSDDSGPEPTASDQNDVAELSDLGIEESKSAESSPADDRLTKRQLTVALRRGGRSAERMGGAVYAAAWPVEQRAPSFYGPLGKQFRMWSMSKPVVALTLLRAAEKRGRPVSRSTRNAIARALIRSENCRQRQVVIELQELLGGPEQARAAVEQVLEEAGAVDARVVERVDPVDPSCRNYMAAQSKQLSNPLADALPFGVSTWTVRDAAAFMRALGDGRFGGPGEEVLELMRQPKRRSTELLRPEDFTADVDWGAGNVFAGEDFAYKAGWGGVQQGKFIAAQMMFIADGSNGYAVAVAFVPETQPPIDDPGSTPAPAAIEEVLGDVDRAMSHDGNEGQ